MMMMMMNIYNIIIILLCINYYICFTCCYYVRKEQKNIPHYSLLETATILNMQHSKHFNGPDIIECNCHFAKNSAKPIALFSHDPLPFPDIEPKSTDDLVGEFIPYEEKLPPPKPPPLTKSGIGPLTKPKAKKKSAPQKQHPLFYENKPPPKDIPKSVPSKPKAKPKPKPKAKPKPKPKSKSKKKPKPKSKSKPKAKSKKKTKAKSKQKSKLKRPMKAKIKKKK